MTLTRALVTLIAACLAAQTTSPSTDEGLIELSVVVTGADGNAIGGLSKNQFRVYADDVRQEVTLFSLTDEPATVTVVVGSPRRAAVAFAGVFLETLRPGNWRALIAYDRHTYIVTDFTRNRYEIEMALKNLGPPRFPESAALYRVVRDDRSDGSSRRPKGDCSG